MSDWKYGCGPCGRMLKCICYHCQSFKGCDCDRHPELICPDIGDQHCNNYEPINKKENENHV